LASTIITAASVGDFLQPVPPLPLEATTSPSDHLGSSRRPENVHCMELLRTLYEFCPVGNFMQCYKLYVVFVHRKNSHLSCI
jgi:hypothetical protein